MLKLREKVALTYKDETYTYKQLMQYSSRYAEHFSAMNSVPEKVMIFSDNNPNYVFAIYGAMRLGAIVVPVDVLSTTKELKYIANDCKPEVIFTTPLNKAMVVETIEQIEGYEPRILTFEDINLEGADALPLVEIPMGDFEKTLAIIYTSGTTGSPKGVMLSYKNIWYNIDAVINSVSIFNEESQVLLILPLHHIFPFAGSLAATIFAGGTVHIADGLTAESIINTLQRGKVTIFIGVPRLYEALAKGIMTKINASFATRMIFRLAALIGSDSFSRTIFKSVHEKFGGHMKYFVCGGAALPAESGKILKTLGFYVLEGYGMTECAPMIAFTRPGERKVGYSGRLLPGLELRFTEKNEICVQGPNVMQGYYNRPEETAQIIRDGWLYTGDTGEMHPKYGLRITGRIKEIIVTSNGKNINPVEIEEEIMHHAPEIKEIAVFLKDDILQALALPDMKKIRSNTGVNIEEAIKTVIEKYNAAAMSYKRIKRFHITSFELPKTRLGKIQRFKLSDLVSGKNKEEAPKEEDLTNKSETYIILKQMVETETGMKAVGDDHFEIDLALDSLGRVALLTSIEERFNIRIDEELLDELSTLNKLTEYVEKNANEISTEGKLSWKEVFESNTEEVEIPHSGFIHWFMNAFIKTIFHLVYRFKSEGRNNIPEGPCLLVANHRSGFDGVFITSKLGWKETQKTYFFAKDKHFQSGFKLFMAKRNNIILMDINKNVRSSLQQMYQVLKQGNDIIIFPEGTRSKDGSLKDFKESFAILSQALNIPIVPIAISGGEKATYNKLRLPRLGNKIDVDFLPPIYPKEEETTAELRDRVVEAIKKGLK
ncbi:MAG: AMP-binding protein [Marinifilaceae bacterium]